MTLTQLNDLDSLVRLGALVIIGVTVYLWKTKRVIGYNTAQVLIITASLLTGITGAMLVGGQFSAGVTILQTSLLYYVFRIMHKRWQKIQEYEKIDANIKERIK